MVEPPERSSKKLSDSLHSVLEPQDRWRENTISTDEAPLLCGAGSAASADQATKESVNPPSGKDIPLLSQNDVVGIGRVVSDQRVVEKVVEIPDKRLSVPRQQVTT